MGSPTSSGSINEVGWRFQSFRINDFEMVDLTGIEPLTPENAMQEHRRSPTSVTRKCHSRPLAAVNA
jgi:hypothetical protein